MTANNKHITALWGCVRSLWNFQIVGWSVPSKFLPENSRHYYPVVHASASCISCLMIRSSQFRASDSNFARLNLIFHLLLMSAGHCASFLNIVSVNPSGPGRARVTLKMPNTIRTYKNLIFQTSCSMLNLGGVAWNKIWGHINEVSWLISAVSWGCFNLSWEYVFSPNFITTAILWQHEVQTYFTKIIWFFSTEHDFFHQDAMLFSPNYLNDGSSEGWPRVFAPWGCPQLTKDSTKMVGFKPR